MSSIEKREHPGDTFIVLSKDAKRFSKKESYRISIEAGQFLVKTLKSTLGPTGMDKLLVSSGGSYTVTNDGFTIADTLDIEHPIGKALVEVAKTQDDEVGDGTTTAVVMAGEMLGKASQLLEAGFHPNLVIDGYGTAIQAALETLDALASEVGPEEIPILEKIAATAMTGKYVEAQKQLLARLCAQASRGVAELGEEGLHVSMERIKFVKALGRMEETELVDGVVIGNERSHPAMPLRVEGARIALIGNHLDVQFLQNVSSEIRVSTLAELRAHTGVEVEISQRKADLIKATGANVLLCGGRVGEDILHHFTRAGIYVVESVIKPDLHKLARATGGVIVTEVENLRAEDLGKAGVVREREVGGERYTFVEGCDGAKAVTLFLRGSANYILDEIERCAVDGVSVVAAILRDGRYLPGGGATEVELARSIRKRARSIGTKAQLVLAAFADALESIPKALAENSGFDPIEKLLALRVAHEKGGSWLGLDLITGGIVDTRDAGVVEPYRVKAQVLKSALDAVTAVLRVDEMIVDGGRRDDGAPPVAKVVEEGKGEQGERGSEGRVR
ncbi:MAG: thermosome subunit [Euryarchaeota archaeon]|nr:thermosome subunit [Euryarchaeota archaeon]